MNCSQARELLSAFYDGELSADARSAMMDHLAGCEECARELEGFRNLSKLAKALPQPIPPAQEWEQLEQRLNVEGCDGSRGAIGNGLGKWIGGSAMRYGMAAAALALVAIGLIGYRVWFVHGDERPMAAVFAEYLDEFSDDPTAAQDLLLANYSGRLVNAEQAARTVGYRPLVADGLPEGYTAEATYVMRMPCCTCVQCLCKRSDGATVAIFEHDDAEPEWFGDRPRTESICSGVRCRLVDVDGRVAASWKQGDRYITAIGMRDTNEVDQLVAWFDKGRDGR